MSRRRTAPHPPPPMPQVPSYKFTGCNHMKCPQCKEDWCWLCGESIVITGMGLAPAHYDTRNPISGCAGRQFTREGTEEPPRGCQRWTRILLFYSPLAIPFYLVALALFLLMTLCMVGRLAADRNARVRWFRWNTLKVLLPGLCRVLVLVPCAMPEGTASVPQRRALSASVF